MNEIALGAIGVALICAVVVACAVVGFLIQRDSDRTLKEWRDRWDSWAQQVAAWNRRAEEEHHAILASLRGLRDK